MAQPTSDPGYIPLPLFPNPRHDHHDPRSQGKKGRGISKRFRRAHSLAGAVFGAFLIVHLTIGATAQSRAVFIRTAGSLDALSKKFPFLEIVVAILPLLMLVVSGGYLLYQEGLGYNVQKCNRGTKLQFFLQRISAVAIFVFLGFHLLRFGLLALLPAYDPIHGYESMIIGVRQFWSARPGSHPLNLAVFGLYLVAILAVSYHLSNGLWTAAINRNYIATDRQKLLWGRGCAAIGTVVGAIGTAAWLAMLTR